MDIIKNKCYDSDIAKSVWSADIIKKGQIQTGQAGGHKTNSNIDRVGELEEFSEITNCVPDVTTISCVLNVFRLGKVERKKPCLSK